MDPFLKVSFWQDDDLLAAGREARWVFAYIISHTDNCGAMRLRWHQMASTLEMSRDAIGIALACLADAPKVQPEREPFIERHGDFIIVPGWLRQNLVGGPLSTMAQQAKRAWSRLPPPVQTALLCHHPWLADPTAGNRKNPARQSMPSASHADGCGKGREGKGTGREGSEDARAGEPDGDAWQPTLEEFMAWGRAFKGLPASGVPGPIPDAWLEGWFAYELRRPDGFLNWKKRAAINYASDWRAGLPKARGLVAGVDAAVPTKTWTVEDLIGGR